MTLTKIEAEIKIPEGFEFDRIDTKTKDGDYGFGGYPMSCHDIEFDDPRIILRKKSRPAKPAYRVYIDEEGIPFVAQRYTDGDTWQTYKEYEYLTGWIEYDPPKKLGE